ncbi:DUF6183 family protein [Streptomyces sp. NPDC048566]|uniref:DUF6183 family protein n=1 Tax=Streptomyces sp. NPDC048566 TaxID=3365569 RepID=UPI00371D3213
MTDRIHEIVTDLPGLEDVTGVCAMVDERVAKGDAAFAGDLGVALAGAFGTAGRMWQFSSVFDHLLRLLATTTGTGNLTQALRLVASDAVAHRQLDRYTASLLASGHAATDLAEAFTGRASEELRACLVHELVLRGVAVGDVPGIARWASSAHWRHHPLGGLPLTLSDLEGTPDLPSYTLSGGGYAMPYGPSEDGERTMTTAACVSSAEESTTPASARAMGAAVANWAEESNGRVEARVFDLAGPLGAEAVPDALLTLGLECLRGAGRKAPLSASTQAPDRAWRVLFAAASTGGAYNSGCHGAYGRLAAWRSLAALAGSPEGSATADVEARARGCVWYGFEAGTTWFEQVAWDIGIAALSADRRRLAVLAATDTD